MIPRFALFTIALTLTTPTALVLGAPQVLVEANASGGASAEFSFRDMARPRQADAAARAELTLLSGRQDRNGGNLSVLNDDRLPTSEDQPDANFFFTAGTEGGRLRLDLGGVIEIQEICSYSWHPGSRGPQVYELLGSDGTAPDFEESPSADQDPASLGWMKIASVDTRPDQGDSGGQYGVCISDSRGSLGSYRYLLFDIKPTESSDAFGNTFYSEIDVVARGSAELKPIETPKVVPPYVVTTGAEGQYRISLDVSRAPGLEDWVKNELVPVVTLWYPKIVDMLPSDGYSAPSRVSIVIDDGMNGVAATGGTGVRAAGRWFRQNLEGEAKGAIVHELVHVVQQYGRARRTNPNRTRTPGWVVEGIADYIRWFRYEPETRGAEITRRNLDRARYDASYRITGNFMNWVTETYSADLVRELNAAAREGRYTEEIWQRCTGKSLEELGKEWRANAEAKLSAAP